MQARRLTETIAARPNRWLDDLPPLDGRLRFFFYASSLCLSIVNLKSPLAGTGFYAETDPLMFRPYGLLKLLNLQYVPVPTVEAIVGVTAVALVAAAVGFGGRVSAIVAAVGALFLQGLFLGSNALNHYYFLPVYCMLALCFAHPSRDRWSVDYWIRAWRRRDVSPAGLGATGLARKLALIAAVGFYFAAGVAKIAHSGPAWADGQSIQFFTELRRGMYPLADFILGHPELAQLGAIGTLLLELGSPLALFSRVWRHLWVLGLIGMHVVIRYTMGPAYWPNVVCLLLLVDWGWIASWLVVGNPMSDHESVDPDASDRNARNIRAGRWLGGSALAIAMSTAVFGVFWWPLTNVYMYCSYFSIEDDLRAGFPRLDYYQASSVQDIAQQFHRTQPPREVGEYLSFQVAVRLTAEDAPPLYLFDSLGTASWKQWVLTVIAPVIIEDLATKPAGRIEHDPSDSDYPAQRFLESFVTVLHRNLSPEVLTQFDRVEIVYPLVASSLPAANRPNEVIPKNVWDEYGKRECNLPSQLVMVPLASTSLSGP